MDLERLRELMRNHQGAIKAWALHFDSLMSVMSELGIDMERPAYPVKLFCFPVIVLEDDQPEGVII